MACLGYFSTGSTPCQIFQTAFPRSVIVFPRPGTGKHSDTRVLSLVCLPALYIFIYIFSYEFFFFKSRCRQQCLSRQPGCAARLASKGRVTILAEVYRSLPSGNYVTLVGCADRYISPTSSCARCRPTWPDSRELELSCGARTLCARIRRRTPVTVPVARAQRDVGARTQWPN